MSQVVDTALGDTMLTWDDLLRTWGELQVPEGWRPELSIEGIHMTPPPGEAHNLIADQVHEALVGSRPGYCGVFQTLGVGIAELGCIYVPDLCVAERSALSRGAEPVPAEHVLLAVEITSRGNAEHDRNKKRWAYAHGPIPQYLLIDRYDEDGPAVSLFTDPAGGVYSKTLRIPFGQPITLAAPFDVELETTAF